MKNTLYRLNGRLDTAGKKINKLEDMATETIQNETKRQKRFKINRISVGYGRTLIGLTLESPKEMKEEAKKKKNFEMPKNFLNLIKL